jgi:hypothetical protein
LNAVTNSNGGQVMPSAAGSHSTRVANSAAIGASRLGDGELRTPTSMSYDTADRREAAAPAQVSLMG